MAADSYDDSKLAALRRGDLAACFGPRFANLPIADPLRLPDGRMKLIDRVTQLDPAGGRYGLGLIRAEADIHPDDWFLTCHFVDDMVMPGTLMYECCAHTLRMFLLRLGWVGEQSEICYEPVAGVSSSLRCRGPVTPKTRVVTYQVEIKELGYRPEPYVLADAMMYADGEAIVRMTNMSLQMTGTTRERIEQIWALREDRTCGKLATGFTTKTTSAPLFSREQILAFCLGNPSDCFGEPYRIFDPRALSVPASQVRLLLPRPRPSSGTSKCSPSSPAAGSNANTTSLRTHGISPPTDNCRCLTRSCSKSPCNRAAFSPPMRAPLADQRDRSPSAISAVRRRCTKKSLRAAARFAPASA
jgi:3-hydroxymyristoyl/3-hydroxydecanoyl-(acyl carrier protein) dehydratase